MIMTKPRELADNYPIGLSEHLPKHIEPDEPCAWSVLSLEGAGSGRRVGEGGLTWENWA